MQDKLSRTDHSSGEYGFHSVSDWKCGEYVQARTIISMEANDGSKWGRCHDPSTSRIDLIQGEILTYNDATESKVLRPDVAVNIKVDSWSANSLMNFIAILRAILKTWS